MSRKNVDLSLIAAGMISASLAHAEPFLISTRTEEIPESGEVTRTVLRTSVCEFTFIPPLDWKPQIDSANATITWTSKDYGSMMRLKIASDGTEKAAKLSASELRLEIHREIPGASVSQEFTCYTAGSSGLAFDLEQAVNDQFPTSSRFAFIPCAGGRVRIQLTCPIKDFSTRQHDFTRFLNSLRIETPAPNQPIAKPSEGS